jgi:ubiquinone/menaquinone biosynthesis C-methylase UbiE
LIKSAANETKIGLDLGCGDGESIRWIDKYCQISVGIDHSIFELRSAIAKIQENQNITLINGDAEILPFKHNSFHLVFCGSILHHLPDYNLALAEVYKCMCDGGVLVATEPCAYNPFAMIRRKYFPSDIHTPDERPFPPNELIEAFNKVFDKVVYRRNYIFSINAGIVEKILGKKVASVYLKCFLAIDKILLGIPIVKNLCWRISIIGFKSQSGSELK